MGNPIDTTQILSILKALGENSDIAPVVGHIILTLLPPSTTVTIQLFNDHVCTQAIPIVEYYNDAGMSVTPKLARWLGFDGGYTNKDEVSISQLNEELNKLDYDGIHHSKTQEGIMVIDNDLFVRMCAVRGGNVWQSMMDLLKQVRIYKLVCAVCAIHLYRS
jgi:hypothetical protein